MGLHPVPIAKMPLDMDGLCSHQLQHQKAHNRKAHPHNAPFLPWTVSILRKRHPFFALGKVPAIILS